MICRKLVVLFIWFCLVNHASGNHVGIHSATKTRLCIKGSISFQDGSGEISLTIWPIFYTVKKKYLVETRTYYAKVTNSTFCFSIDSVFENVYFLIGRGRYKGTPINISDLYVASPGDSIFIKVRRKLTENSRSILADDNRITCTDCTELQFSGNNPYKYEVRYRLYQTLAKLELEWSKHVVSSGSLNTITDLAKRLHALFEYLWKGEKAVLNTSSRLLLNSDYEIIRADILGKTLDYFFYGVKNLYEIRRGQITRAESDEFLAYMANIFKKEDSFFKGAPAKSAFLPATLIEKEILENELFGRGALMTQIYTRYTSALKDRLMLNYMIDYNDKSNIDAMIDSSLGYFSNGPYKQLVLNLANYQKVGRPVFNFALEDASGTIFKLSDFKGKIIFVDFWYTGCGHCAEYYKSHLSKLEERYLDDENIKFVTISIDANKNTWIKGLRSGLYTSSRALNLCTGIQGMKHELIQQLKIQGFPHPLIIDRDGNLLTNESEVLRTENLPKLVSTIDSILKCTRQNSEYIAMPAQ